MISSADFESAVQELQQNGINIARNLARGGIETVIIYHVHRIIMNE